MTGTIGAGRAMPAVAAALLLAACGSHGGRPVQGWAGADGRGSGPASPSPDTPAGLKLCLADLAAAGAQFQPLPDRRFANGCSATGAVKLVAIGIPVTNLGAVRCGAALGLTQWVRQAVQSAAHDRLGARVVRIESFGSFACRPVNNVAGGRLSEHGRANAVDIAGFVLADGRRITIKDGWNGADPRARAFLRQVRDAACRRFAIVLGPDSNAFHRDHLHFDMGNGHVCG